MNRRIPRGGAALLVLFVVVGVVLFALFASRVGGPTLRTDSPFRLQVRVADTQGLTTRSDVRMRGVVIGHVDRVRASGDHTTLGLVLDGTHVRLRRGTTVRVGTKTALGEAYVDVTPGPAGAGPLGRGVTLAGTRIRPAVELDEALQALDAPTRGRLQRTARELGRGLGSRRAADQVRGAVTALRGTVDRTHALTERLEDQSGDLTRIVTAGGQVVRELAVRDGRLRTLVGSGVRTLDAVGARDRALRATVDEAPRLLERTRATLGDVRPLAARTQPVLGDLRAAAPQLEAAARALPSASANARGILARGRGLERGATSVLRSASPLLDAAGPAARSAEPALADVTTMVRYLAPRKQTVASWFSNTAALGQNGDAKGRWARFFIFVDPATLFAQKSQLPENAYTPPGDALSPRAFRPGDFERLLPTPAPASP